MGDLKAADPEWVRQWGAWFAAGSPANGGRESRLFSRNSGSASYDRYTASAVGSTSVPRLPVGIHFTKPVD